MTSFRFADVAFLCPPQLKVPTTDNPAATVNFRKLLLNRCQKEFEKDQDDDVIFEKKQKELEASKDVRHLQNNLDPWCCSGQCKAIP